MGLPVIASRMVIQPCRGRYRRRLGIVMLTPSLWLPFRWGRQLTVKGLGRGHR